jgi:hypothetical protein
MNDTKLTTLDPAKTYVDYLGRKWTHSHGAYWRTPNMVTLMYDLILLQMIPDLREHVPQWYEDAVAKGPWVLIEQTEEAPAFIACLGNDGYSLRIRCGASGKVCSLMTGKWGSTILDGLPLEDCLAAAEPLVWKGVAS